MNSATLYRYMVAHLEANGWEREEVGSGWWFHSEHEEGTIGTAVEHQLDADGIDTRLEP